MKSKLAKYLEQFITGNRKEMINKVMEQRTRYITVVLEDIFQSQNASAVLRTCECFGIQDVHIIENQNKYVINPDVALGSNKWLNIIKYCKGENNTKKAIDTLKLKGYRIVATIPGKESAPLDDFCIESGRVALLFGTELNGLSDEIIQLSDEYLNIPMFGFTRSFNISVSAAIILHSLVSKLKRSAIDWRLSEEEKKDLKIKWLKESIRKSDILENTFMCGLNS
jgi:tRNA (guanosine-2'-O-)-methyltransferase